MTFAEFVRASGLCPSIIAQDGRWHRCPTENHPRSKNGAYKLAVDGRIGWVQDWSTQAEPSVWRPERTETGPRYDPREIARQRAKEQADREAAIAAAREFYASCSPLIGGHPYLEAHGLDMAGCYGLRIDPKGWLVVPAYLGRQILTVQRIAPDGAKRFWPGAPVKGASYTVERRGATLTVLCEGLATGLALYAAVRTSRVVVAFNSGNMANVAPQLPGGFTVVAADNDHGTEERIGANPGIVAAEFAAGLIGCGVAVPSGMDGTDFADLRREKMAMRTAARGPNDTAAGLQRAVDAEIAAEIMRHARFRAHAGKAS